MKKPEALLLSFLLSALVYGAPASTSSSRDTSLIYVTLEEHYDPPASDSLQTNPVVQLMIPLEKGVYGEALKKVGSVNQTRLDDMNQSGIRIQVVSNDPTPPALTSVEDVTLLNNQLATAIAPYPDRFRGFCFLPMALPEQAAAELERCISQLGFVGALVDSHLANEIFYDDTKFDPIWEAAQRLDVPIYLHPTYPQIEDVNGTKGRFKPEDNNWPSSVAAILGTSAYGWHTDCGLQFLRLWLGGVFDRFPQTKVVLGHMGETVPYMLDRANSTIAWAKSNGTTLPDTWARNVWVTTSGFFSLNPFATLLRTTSTDRIMFSVDYPWATNEEGVEFMESLRASNMVTPAEWEGIAYRNAERFLNLAS